MTLWPSSAHKTKWKPNRARVHPSSSPISLLPVEGLQSIFGYLDPHSLFCCCLVSKLWNETIQRDSTWAIAFSYRFGAFLGHPITPGNWRREFIARFKILTKWRNQQPNPPVSVSLQVSSVSVIAHNPSISVLVAASNDQMLATRLNSTNNSLIKPNISPFNDFMRDPNLTCTASAISPDTASIAWALTDHSIVLATASSRVRIGSVREGHTAPVSLLVFNQVEETLASAALDGTLKIWHLRGSLQRSLSVLNPAESLVALHFAGPHLVALTASNTLYVWNLSENTLQSHRVAHQIDISQLDLQDDGTALFTFHLASEPLVRSWLITASELTRVAHTHKADHISNITSLSVIPSRSNKAGSLENGPGFVIAGDDIGRVFLWLQGHSDVYQQFYGIQYKITSLAIFNPLIMVGDADGTIRIYDILSASLLRSVRTKARATENRDPVVRIFPEFGGLLAMCESGKLISWKTGSGVRTPKTKVKTPVRSAPKSQRYQDDLEMYEETSATTSALFQERRIRQFAQDEQEYLQNVAGPPVELSNMTEEELVNYATLLSLDSAPDFMLDEELEAPTPEGYRDFDTATSPRIAEDWPTPSSTPSRSLVSPNSWDGRRKWSVVAGSPSPSRMGSLEERRAREDRDLEEAIQASLREMHASETQRNRS